jgi:cytochrome c oxidase subunit 2
MKKLITIVTAISLILALTACGGGNNAGNTQAAPAGDAKEVKIVATNYEFDQPEYTVAKGETVNFVLENAKGMHGIEIKGLGVKIDGAGNQVITVDKAGEYDIICNIPCGPGHLQMKSKLIVQ